jgi:hypothetical protein
MATLRNVGLAAVLSVGAIGAVPSAAGASAERPAGGDDRRPESVALLDVSSAAHDINDHGVVVGSFLPEGASEGHAFRRSPDGRVADLGPGVAEAVNEAGVVVGWRSDAAGTHAIRWGRNGVAHDLGMPGSSWATDINDRGTVVGYSAASGSPIAGFVIEADGDVEDLSAPSGLEGSDIWPSAVNDRDEIVGVAQTDDGLGRLRPVLWSGRNHVATELPGRRELYDVSDINNRGAVVGSTTDPDYLAVTWQGRRHRETDVGEPGAPAWGRAINDEGRVAGVQLGTGKVFVWYPRTGRTTVFGGLSDEPYTWDEPSAINSRGDIVGYSTGSDGETRATLWRS